MEHWTQNNGSGTTPRGGAASATVVQSNDGSVQIHWRESSPATRVHARTTSRRWATAVAATLAVGVLLGAAMILLSLLSVSAPGNASASSIKEPATGDPRSKGNADAPVVITLWSDFQCPGCRTFALNYEPEIERLFVNTGKARYVSRSLAFLGPESFFAAQAAQCAADQRRYWGYTGLLWQRYRGENTGTFSGENLKRFAAELGLDQAAFNSCLDKGQKITTVAAEASFGNSLGIKSTPSVLVNDKLVDGVPTLERIGQMVEAELEKKR